VGSLRVNIVTLINCFLRYCNVNSKLSLVRLPDSFTRVYQHVVFVPSETYAVASLSSARQDDLLPQVNLVIVHLINTQTLKRDFSIMQFI